MTVDQTTPERGALISAFLAEAGWGAAHRADLAGDASNRRYLRLEQGARRAVLMDAPPERGEDIRPFLAVTAELRARALSAPEPLAADPEAGLLLLEDLGDALFARVTARDAAAEPALYAAAVDLIAAETRAPVAADLAPYGEAALAAEARLATDWYLRGALGQPPPEGLAEEIEALLLAALAAPAADRSALVLRDYHAENLIWLPDRAGHARVGLLDYQDALLGSPAYDLVSLLEDARRDLAPGLAEAMLARFLAARPDLDATAFRADYAALGVQRNLKILGVFARLAMRDGKPRYLALMPRVWGHLRGDLDHPVLATLGRLLDRHLPEPDDATRARIGAAR